MIVAAVDGGDDLILLLLADPQSIQCLTGSSVRADQGLVVQAGECGMTSVFLAASGAGSGVMIKLLHGCFPSVL